MEGGSILFLGLIILTGIALVMGLVSLLAGKADPDARGGCGSTLLVCVATLWAFFFGLNWLSSYDEDDIPGTYTLMVRKADNASVVVPSCHLVLTDQKTYQFRGNCRLFTQCREGHYWVQIADENNYGVTFTCGDKQQSALFNRPSMDGAYTLTFDHTWPDSANSLFYSFRRD